ncbi:hypothetical protein [Dethiosulfatarculus sandiegensis]|uniref:Cytochrome C n=1 Tax=Dethiosulfatarculus sandiegensis TaxID=1429043 RepID=A0A0D2IYT8_9BACT|nr:hypothetical protein [Dethiosulfatarculus sandiegensis]KIX11199.1 hypothetical protein X474_25275 [Dethiosulfatarculus sandiegensis]
MKKVQWCLVPLGVFILGWAVLMAQAGPSQGLVLEKTVFPAPVYHSPLDEWRVLHTKVVGEGQGNLNPMPSFFKPKDCLVCHSGKKFCTPCHAYVGSRLKLNNAGMKNEP